jgi:hypothetical protein
MNIELNEITGLILSMRTFDLSLAIGSGILFLISAIGVSGWVWSLRKTENFLYPLLFTVAGFKYLLAYWAFGNAYAMIFTWNFPPIETLAPRIGFAILAAIQARMIWKYYIQRRK